MERILLLPHYWMPQAQTSSNYKLLHQWRSLEGAFSTQRERIALSSQTEILPRLRSKNGSRVESFLSASLPFAFRQIFNGAVKRHGWSELLVESVGSKNSSRSFIESDTANQPVVNCFLPERDRKRGSFGMEWISVKLIQRLRASRSVSCDGLIKKSFICTVSTEMSFSSQRSLNRNHEGI